MVRHLATLTIALVVTMPLWAGELDREFAGAAPKARVAAVTSPSSLNGPSLSQASQQQLQAPVALAKGSELDRESPTQASRGGRGWGGGHGGWGGHGWGGGHGGWGGRGWGGGWGRGYRGWGWGGRYGGWGGWGWGGWGGWGWGGWGWGRGWGWGWGYPYYTGAYVYAPPVYLDYGYYAPDYGW
jgi:hypothetical protein